MAIVSQGSLIGNAAEVVAHRAAIVSQSLTRLSIMGLAGDVPEMTQLAAMPELDRITELHLQGDGPSWRNIPPPREAMAALGRCTSLKNVRKLSIQTNVLDDDGAVALARAPWLSSVSELLLMEHPDLRSAGAAAIFRRLSTLDRLYVQRCALGEAGMRALASVAIRSIYLDGCSTEASGARLLFESPALARTEELKIAGRTIGDAIGALGRSSYVGALRKLELPGCGLSAEGVAAFAGGRAFPSLTELDLSHNLLGDDAALSLASSASFPALTKLDLGDNEIGERGAAALGATTGLRALTHLGLRENKLYSGKQHVHEWSGGMWEAGSTVVDERLSPDELRARFVRKPGLQIF